MFNKKEDFVRYCKAKSKDTLIELLWMAKSLADLRGEALSVARDTLEIISEAVNKDVSLP
jgi:hypothetical protein